MDLLLDHAVAAYLAGGTALAGRSRTTGSNAEADPRLGRHLRTHGHTGFVCRYDPDPDHPVRWTLTA